MSVVIIPAYKPDETLVAITDSLWTYGCQIVVVDDGSGCEYKSIFEQIKDVCIVLHHLENRGKGSAIKTALNYIRQELWSEKVIGIMDADGQHSPEDMVELLRVAETHRKSLIIGVRDVGKTMPARSRIGNTLTRYLFYQISGVKISDTQTGLRAFDADFIEKMCEIKGERYEYEMNVLLEMVKSEVTIKEIPIRTIYRDKKNSTSHFRVIQDSLRIYSNFLKFACSSLSSFGLDYMLFLLLVFVLPKGVRMVLLANILARIISAFYNYSMNCRYVFHTYRKIRTAVDYFVLAVVILLLNNFILENIVSVFHLSAYIAKLVTEFILFMISWQVQKRVIFKNHSVWKGKESEL